jgi:predicted enzyme related to lactoylglutathione lyase
LEEKHMTEVVNVLAVVPVADFEPTVQWYERLIGRAPDRRPMDGCAEWQLARTGGIQVYHAPDDAGSTNVIVGVDDVDEHVAVLAGRGVDVEAFDVPSGQFRLATLQDPAGNTITFGQTLET